MKKFLDTSQAIALGPSGTSNLNYKPVVTFYAQEEMFNHNIDTSSASTIYCPSWPDFQCMDSGGYGSYYQWIDSRSESMVQIYYYTKPFGKKAPCRHNATVQIFYRNMAFYCCRSVAQSNVDFSYVTGTILNPEIMPIDTRDTCLGKTCKFIHSRVILKHQNNSTS